VTDEEILAGLRTRIRDGRPTDGRPAWPVPAPATPEAVAEAEEVIGFPLPRLLRRIYLEVANGGVGPFGGIQGIRGGYASDWDNLVDLYVAEHAAPADPDLPPPPPPGVVFFCDFGCAMWTLLDCRHEQGQMWWWEEGDRHKLRLTLADWLTDWLNGALPDPPAYPDRRLPDDAWTRPTQT
jgi:hypothetical protein